jgi:uncharacterized membrane protein YphA (DoxX/SURF4 family)
MSIHYKRISIAYNTIRQISWLNTFVILTRYLIAFAFIPSGLKKIAGERFTQMSIASPIGYFFEGLYQTGIYWNFIGWAQIIAAFLLMTQRFATIGAIFFFFIISNIWVITISLHFSGTWIITSLMLLAVIMLLAWDFHKLKYLFYADNFYAEKNSVTYPTYNRIWVVTGLVLFALSVVGLVLLVKEQPSSMIFSRILLVSILLIVTVAIYFNRKKVSKKK